MYLTAPPAVVSVCPEGLVCKGAPPFFKMRPCQGEGSKPLQARRAPGTPGAGRSGFLCPGAPLPGQGQLHRGRGGAAGPLPAPPHSPPPLSASRRGLPHPPCWLITAPGIPHWPVPVLRGGGEGDRGSLCSFPSPASVHLLCEKACLRKPEPVPAGYL